MTTIADIKEEKGFKYIEKGEGETLLLLHGLFGALSNWEDVLGYYSTKYRVVIPLLPIYELPLLSAGIKSLTEFIAKFVEMKQLRDMTLLGNSLGGHLALAYTLLKPENVKRIVLTGSSGLFENSMGGSYPKRGKYEYIKERVEYTFYDPAVASKDLVDEVFETTRSIPKCMSIVAVAKSAQRHNLASQLHLIKVPVLLIWGLNDTITPPNVGYEFDRLLPNSELHFVDKCCHAPMMEHPERFNALVQDFLTRN
jgi:pimeloyl-ACP methyl ester carboxylesterase